LRLSEGLCFRCKFIQNKEDYIRRAARAALDQETKEQIKDVPSDPPMETAVIVEPGDTEPPKKKKRVPRKKKKE